MLVYVVRNLVNGKCYVGKTIGTLKRRWCGHICSSQNESHLPFHNAIHKYGPESFELSVVCYADNHDELYRLEQQTIAEYRERGIRLYNLTDGGPGSYGLKHSDETKAKLHALNTGKPRTPEAIAKGALKHKGQKYHVRVPAPRLGEKHWRFGKRHTAETRAKMSTAAKGKPKSKEHCAALSKAAIARYRKPDCAPVTAC